jgi:hypothetical protein
VNVGLPLGVLMGFVSGAAFFILVQAAQDRQRLRAVSGLTGLPAIWFGGGWLTTVFDVEEILSWYVSSLCLTAVPIATFGLFLLFRDALRGGRAG